MSITIIINTVNKQPITVEVNLSDKISEAKSKYVQKGGDAKYNQWIFDAEVLEDSKTVNEVGISDNDEITANERFGGLYQIKS